MNKNRKICDIRNVEMKIIVQLILSLLIASMFNFSCYGYIAGGELVSGSGKMVYAIHEKKLYISSDYGLHWNNVDLHKIFALDPLTKVSVHGVATANDNLLISYRFQNNGEVVTGLAHSNNYAHSFTTLFAHKSKHKFDLDGTFYISPDNNIVFTNDWCELKFGRDYRLCYSLDSGKTWNYHKSLGEISRIASFKDHFFAANQYQMSYSLDGGSNWSDFINENENINPKVVSNAKGRILLGMRNYTNDGTSIGLLASDDNGLHWYSINHNILLLKGIYELFTYDSHIYVLSADGKHILVSHDSGEHWKAVPSKNGYRIFANDKIIIVVEDANSYHYSQDEGQNWEKIKFEK